MLKEPSANSTRLSHETAQLRRETLISEIKSDPGARFTVIRSRIECVPVCLASHSNHYHYVLLIFFGAALTCLESCIISTHSNGTKHRSWPFSRSRCSLPEPISHFDFFIRHQHAAPECLRAWIVLCIAIRTNRARLWQ